MQAPNPWWVASCIVLAAGSKNSTFPYKVFGYLTVTIIFAYNGSKIQMDIQKNNS